jgi:phosphoribosylformylglycinamidine (FGAM) synthase PurS component
MIDSLKLFETLKSGDLAEPQARAIVQAIGSAFDDNELHQSKVLAAKVDAAKMEAEVQQLATSLKEDISGVRIELGAEMRALGTELRAEMSAMSMALRADMSAIRAGLKADLVQLESRLESRFETKIAESKSAMIRWMFIFWIGQVAAMRLLR